MNPVVVRELLIGEGMPKICVPIVGRTYTEIVTQAKAFSNIPADIAEWRVDWYEDAADLKKVQKTAKAIRRELKNQPLLFTFRTLKEGGEREIDTRDYEELNLTAAKYGWADLVDVEAFHKEGFLDAMVTKIKENGAKVIASNHDFYGTPEQDEIVRRLRIMQDAGADILKIAVMPKQKQDVLTLLKATLEMAENDADRPIITMSMAGQGAISRLTGEFFGSAVTFASAGTASAPGQMNVWQLKEALKLLHNSFR